MDNSENINRGITGCPQIWSLRSVKVHCHADLHGSRYNITDDQVNKHLDIVALLQELRQLLCKHHDL